MEQKGSSEIEPAEASRGGPAGLEGTPKNHSTVGQERSVSVKIDCQHSI